MKPEKTPLHLLSEVAMGDPANRSTFTGNLSQQSCSGQANFYSPHSTIQATGPSNYGPAESPHRMGSTAPSTHSNSTPAPATTPWPSVPNFSPSINKPHDLNMGNRAYYPPFPPAPADPSPTYGIHPTTSAMQPGTYSDMSAMSMPLSQPMDMASELGVDSSFDTENLFMLGNIMDEGLFSFPFSFDGNFQ